MKKQSFTQKKLGYDRIRAAVRTSRSLAEAARTLGVDRSTLHRWIQADPTLKQPLEEREALADELAAGADDLTPDEWLAWVMETYEPTKTERVLLGLAVRALKLAHDESARPADRVSAMGRFQRLLADLDLEDPRHAPEKPAKLYAVK